MSGFVLEKGYIEGSGIGGEDAVAGFGPTIGTSIPIVRPSPYRLSDTTELSITNARYGFDIGVFGRFKVSEKCFYSHRIGI